MSRPFLKNKLRFVFIAGLKDARQSRLLEPAHWGRQWPSPESHESWAKRKISLADDKTVLVEALLCLRDLLITLRTRLPLRLPDTNK